MKLPTIGELVKGGKWAEFQRFDYEGNLWYSVDDFDFPIPPAESKGGVFKRNEKAINLMRWIRKHLEYLEEAIKEAREHEKEEGKR